jgi:hypothetical protein
MASNTSQRNVPTKGAFGKGAPNGKAARATAKGRKPIRPPKQRPWGLIVLIVFLVVALVPLLGYPIYKNWDAHRPFGQQSAQRIAGVHNYRTDPAFKGKLTQKHVPAKQLTYLTAPPVGGDHNPSPQNCEGDVYKTPIANENAVHSLEHGAVWVTYNPNLPAADVQKLEKLVRGVEYTMLSPYPGLDKPVSVQSWGFQLKVDNASDPRIAKFVNAFKLKSTMEPGTACSGGVTQADGKPHDAPNGGMTQPGTAPGGAVPGGAVPGGTVPGGTAPGTGQ